MATTPRTGTTTTPRRPASAAYTYRTPFFTAHAGLVSSPMARRKTTSTPNRPSTAASSTFNAKLCATRQSRNRTFRGPRIPGVPRPNLTASARGRPIEMMWSIPSNTRPGVKPPPKIPWSREENVFTNTNFVLRTVSDKSHAHDKQLQTIELFRDEDQSLADESRTSIITKKSMGRALAQLNFDLLPGQVDTIFRCLSARRDVNDHNDDSFQKNHKHSTTMNAATFLKNLKSCHELDSEEHHATRFGSSQFAYTSRRENNGVDERHRFPARKKKKEATPAMDTKDNKTATHRKTMTQSHHLTSNINPFHHYEFNGHDEAEKLKARMAFRKKQRKKHHFRHTHRDSRKRPMSRTQSFMKSNVDYTTYGQHTVARSSKRHL